MVTNKGFSFGFVAKCLIIKFDFRISFFAKALFSSKLLKSLLMPILRSIISEVISSLFSIMSISLSNSLVIFPKSVPKYSESKKAALG